MPAAGLCSFSYSQKGHRPAKHSSNKATEKKEKWLVKEKLKAVKTKVVLIETLLVASDGKCTQTDFGKRAFGVHITGSGCCWDFVSFLAHLPSHVPGDMATSCFALTSCQHVNARWQKNIFPSSYNKGLTAHCHWTELANQWPGMEYGNWPGLRTCQGRGSGCWGTGCLERKNNRERAMAHDRLWPYCGCQPVRQSLLGYSGDTCGCRGLVGMVGGVGFKVSGVCSSPAHCFSLPFARLISHTPSYCDELLFGFQPEGVSREPPLMAKGDVAKLHTLFWTPPATPRGSHSPCPRETPLRAIRPAGPSKTEPRVAVDSWKLSVDGLDSPHPLRQGRSHSLTHLNSPTTGLTPTSAHHVNGPRDAKPSLSGVTFRSPLVTSRACSISVSVPATPRQGGATQKPKPPWK